MRGFYVWRKTVLAVSTIVAVARGSLSVHWQDALWRRAGVEGDPDPYRYSVRPGFPAHRLLSSESRAQRFGR